MPEPFCAADCVRVPDVTRAGTVSGVVAGVIRPKPLTWAFCGPCPGGSWPRYSLSWRPRCAPAPITTGGSTSETGKGRAGRHEPGSRCQLASRWSTSTDRIVSSPWTSLTETLLPVT